LDEEEDGVDAVLESESYVVIYIGANLMATRLVAVGTT
jgi:hypothetical protein